MYTVTFSDLLKHVAQCTLLLCSYEVFGVGCGRPNETLKTEPASQEFAQIYDIYVGGKGQIATLLGCHCSGHCQSVIWNPYYLVQQS